MKWNGKVIISVSKPVSGIIIIWLDGAEAGQAFEVGTQMWIENVIEGELK